MRLVQTELARKGGEARAKKYDRATLTKWAKMGGRPKKKAESVSKRGKR